MLHHTTLNIGPAPFTSEGTVAVAKYPNGEIALLIFAEDGEEQAVATVALEAAPRVGPQQVWLKGWTENEGLPEAFEKAGLLRLTGERFPTGFCSAQLADVLPPFAEAIARACSPSDAVS